MQHSIVSGSYARINSPGAREHGYIHLVADVKGEWARMDGKRRQLSELIPCCDPANTKVGDIVQTASRSLGEYFGLDAEVLKVPSKATGSLHVRFLETGETMDHAMFCFAHKSDLYPEPETPKEESVPLSLSLFFSNG